MAIDLNDKTANGNTLTNDGAAEVAGLYAGSTTACDLELTETDYLYAADSASLSITGNLTIELWVKLESAPADGSNYCLVEKFNATGNQRSYAFRYYRSGATYYLRAGLSSNGSNDALVDTAYTLTPGTAYHLALTITPGNNTTTQFEFFVNGSSIGNGSVIHTLNAVSIYDSTSALAIGSDADLSTGYLDGIIDDVRIWNDIRTVTEINNNKAVNLVGNEANLVAYYPFETISSESVGGIIHFI
jgi:hypothetical protein